MYKRRVKTGSLGIVRSSSSTQQKSNNDNPNTIQSGALKRLHSTPEKNSLDDPDEVLSDCEPSPKKSKRYMSGISFAGKDTSTSGGPRTPVRSINNFNVRPTSSEKKNKSQTSNNKQTQQLDVSPKRHAGKNNSINPKSFLEDIFLQAGMLLSDGNSPNVLSE